jgi:hypothetical protein
MGYLTKDYEAVTEAVGAFLLPKYKLYMLAGRTIKNATGGPNKKAIGYLAGFAEMTMRERHLELGGVMAFGTIKAIFFEVWGVEEGDEYLTVWIENVNHPETLKGYRLGVEDGMHANRFPLGLRRLGECWDVES